MPSTADNAKMHVQMHIQVDIHGNPDRCLRVAGREAWLFFGWCMKEKEFSSSFSFSSLEFSLGYRIDPVKIPCGRKYCYNKKGVALAQM